MCTRNNRNNLQAAYRGELIGLPVLATVRRGKAEQTLEGIIIDETKYTLTIKTQMKRRMILKANATLTCQVRGTRITLAGKQLVGRPEDRIKKTWTATHQRS